LDHNPDRNPRFYSTTHSHYEQYTNNRKASHPNNRCKSRTSCNTTPGKTFHTHTSIHHFISLACTDSVHLPIRREGCEPLSFLTRKRGISARRPRAARCILCSNSRTPQQSLHRYSQEVYDHQYSLPFKLHPSTQHRNMANKSGTPSANTLKVLKSRFKRSTNSILNIEPSLCCFKSISILLISETRFRTLSFMHLATSY
jgi:hypothetical protein